MQQTPGYFRLFLPLWELVIGQPGQWAGVDIKLFNDFVFMFPLKLNHRQLDQILDVCGNGVSTLVGLIQTHLALVGALQSRSTMHFIYCSRPLKLALLVSEVLRSASPNGLMVLAECLASHHAFKEVTLLNLLKGTLGPLPDVSQSDHPGHEFWHSTLRYSLDLILITVSTSPHALCKALKSNIIPQNFHSAQFLPDEHLLLCLTEFIKTQLPAGLCFPSILLLITQSIKAIATLPLENTPDARLNEIWDNFKRSVAYQEQILFALKYKPPFLRLSACDDPPVSLFPDNRPVLLIVLFTCSAAASTTVQSSAGALPVTSESTALLPARKVTGAKANTQSSHSGVAKWRAPAKRRACTPLMAIAWRVMAWDTPERFSLFFVAVHSTPPCAARAVVISHRCAYNDSGDIDRCAPASPASTGDAAIASPPPLRIRFSSPTFEKLGYTTAEFLLTPLQFGIPNSRLRYYLLAKRSPCSFKHSGQLESGPLHFIPGRGQEEPWVDVGEIREYLDEEIDEKCVIPDKVLLKWGRLFNIVLPSSQRTCCFTRGYTQLIERAGSILQLNEALDTTTVFDASLAQRSTHNEPVRTLDPLRLRYFSPNKLLRLFAFSPLDTPPRFIWPTTISRKTKYRLIGNSVNVRVVQELIPQDRPLRL
ncbi:S-adenosyl-L-methionine-dependent methyltransferase [Mycena indigotica]|uniref:S-adenosyl-L-methionine-dependent methyltransferase n=1 Tax=Mycena indigotica TaxID=2126181 RepID=A0A8H6S7X0_9AGAR|nr:S-adenosyl-L-methionine-dependent methyltransferase [Mycena indigotica]KAF7293412.1 S-adenosyl-L-methionine-dependent methyltransferase [Mycena indigotica]